MGVNIVLKYEDIKGESAVKGHEGEIDVLMWDWGCESNVWGPKSGQGNAGGVDARNLTITKYFDRASPALCGRMWILPAPDKTSTAVLTCIKVGGNSGPLEFIQITLQRPYVCSIHHSRETKGGELTERFVETVSLGFGGIEILYRGQKADQSKDASVSAHLTLDQGRA
jgi:type VI secretion system secreted protein Hcp